MEYTNSSMVAYTKLSPNHSGQRTMAIDRITPHCVVGQCTAEGLGDWFAKSSTQASSNYGIDKDGHVGMYVEEKNRSWCSSSSANDQRAVTIECASDTTEPYAFRDIVYQRLIELCVDICRRNGKTKLLWLADKDKTLNYQPKSDEMILTVHRWFANKSCPGNWMFARMGDLAEKVTAALGGGAEVPSTDVPVPELVNDPEKMIWLYLMGKIGNAYGVAGLMGNLFAESGLRANNLQNNFEKTLGLSDDNYTLAVDSGAYGNFVKDKAGYGLAQWTFWSRKQELLDFAKSKGKSIGDLQMQLDFLWKELKDSYPAVLTVLREAEKVREASDAVLLWYERPADTSDAVQEKRAGYGQGYYDKYAGKPADSGEPSGEVIRWYRVRKTWADSKSQKGAYKILENAKKCADQNPGYKVFDADGKIVYEPKAAEPAVKVPFLVRVSVPDLNIRTGPGTDHPRTGMFTGIGTFTIVEVKKGKGSSEGWGRLKSGAGWIALSLVKRV